MPTTYAHDTFGMNVFRQLPKEVQEIIRPHMQLYRIGLHGPDIFFYYRLRRNYVNQTGVRLHGEIAYPFFQRGVKLVQEEKDNALLAYLLGFACHFKLDSTCHPYVYHIAHQVKHTHIEKEMDRVLMERDGLDPLTYFPAKVIIPSKENAETIQKMFPHINARQIYEALRGMRKSTSMMIYGDGRRQKVILLLLRFVGQYHKMGDHFMKKEADPACREYLEILVELFDRAQSEAPALLTALYNCAKKGGELPKRFQRNYK